MKPDDFATILIEKLENVRRNQEAQEMLDRKLFEVCFSFSMSFLTSLDQHS